MAQHSGRAGAAWHKQAPAPPAPHSSPGHPAHLLCGFSRRQVSQLLGLEVLGLAAHRPPPAALVGHTCRLRRVLCCLLLRHRLLRGFLGCSFGCLLLQPVLVHHVPNLLLALDLRQRQGGQAGDY